MKHIVQIIVIILVLLVLFINTAADTERGNEGNAETDDNSVKKIFLEAKKSIYAKEWPQAVMQFKKITAAFPGGEWGDDSLYWLSYSLNKLGEKSDDLHQVLEIKKEALENLALLKTRYPGSEWLDEAKLLTMEIAQALADRGLKDYEKYITNGVKEEENADLKAVALAALLETDKEKAFPAIEKIIRTGKDPELRRKVIFALAQIKDARVVPLLVEVAKTDPDTETKKQAVFWLGQLGTPESYKQLVNIYEKSGDMELKKHVIFSISQVGGDAAVKDLIHIFKIEKNLGLKKQVIFWLGQSESKEAQAFILKILE
ncbi:MAG TPA: HEAT repeat domain-containing protein [Candidatus Deferrimicrobium sp.]|nr:HEAT repeat domain-containing protein [Candidatus Deferrimicrobium sp.]